MCEKEGRESKFFIINRTKNSYSNRKINSKVIRRNQSLFSECRTADDDTEIWRVKANKKLVKASKKQMKFSKKPVKTNKK